MTNYTECKLCSEVPASETMACVVVKINLLYVKSFSTALKPGSLAISAELDQAVQKERDYFGTAFVVGMKI